MNLSKEQLARVWLQCAPLYARPKIAKLVSQQGGALNLWNSFTPAFYEALGPDYFSFLADSRAVQCGPALRQLEALGAYPLFRGEEGYPAALVKISDGPDVLFVRGALPRDGSPAIAMVGSRRSTRYGSSQARRIARGLAESGVAVISGLARGIDAASHWGALDGQGLTVAVLGCGLGHIYPPENKDLAEKILASGGALVSELAPDELPLPHHFPARNRIISGLAQGLLLIEAQLKSGTHTTVDYARSQGKPLFALPGNVDAPGSELPLQLLRNGAALCVGPEDILSRMDWAQKPPEQPSFLPEEPALDENDPNAPILRALALEEKTLEELIDETGLSAGELGAQLTMLEICGTVERRAGRAYALVRAR